MRASPSGAEAASLQAAPERPARSGIWRYAKRFWPFYVMLVPGVLYFLVFKYVPLLGSVIAFQDYNVYGGFWKSDWVGLKWFQQFFEFSQFRRLLWNTLAI